MPHVSRGVAGIAIPLGVGLSLFGFSSELQPILVVASHSHLCSSLCIQLLVTVLAAELLLGLFFAPDGHGIPNLIVSPVFSGSRGRWAIDCHSLWWCPGV